MKTKLRARVKRKPGGVCFHVTWQPPSHICTRGSFVLVAAEILNFVLNSLHGDAGFIAAIKTPERKMFIPERI